VNQVLAFSSTREFEILPFSYFEVVSENRPYDAIQLTTMASNPIPEVPDNQLPTRVSAASIPDIEELDQQALRLLRELFLLLDRWDRQGSC